MGNDVLQQPKLIKCQLDHGMTLKPGRPLPAYLSGVRYNSMCIYSTSPCAETQSPLAGLPAWCQIQLYVHIFHISMR
jgi:hypothetical protein